MVERYKRWTELSLLPWPILFLLMGLALIGLTIPDRVNQWHLIGAALAIGILLGTHQILRSYSPRSDQLLLPTVAMLSSIGLVMVARLAPELALRQSLWVILGLALAAATVIFLPSITLLQKYKYSFAVLGLSLVAATFLFGIDPNGSGSRLWLSFGGRYFQPSEILKLMLVIFLAGYLEDKRELLSWSSSRFAGLKLPPLPYLGPLVVMWAVSMLLLIAQHDLGATLLLFSVFLSMLYMASCRAVYAWGGLGAFVGGAYLCYKLFHHIRIRVDIWIDPWSRAQAEGYQLIQALVALASGGILGRGLGYGYPEYIPAVHTDFVIAAIGEEMGLAGSMAVVALYMVLIYRGFRIALDVPEGFSSLLAAGLTTVLGLQAVVILAGTLKLIPITGITLPFISYGGSSIVTNYVILGLLLRLSTERRGSCGS